MKETLDNVDLNSSKSKFLGADWVHIMRGPIVKRKTFLIHQNSNVTIYSLNYLKAFWHIVDSLDLFRHKFLDMGFTSLM